MILTIHEIIRPLLIHLTLDLQKPPEDVEQTPFLLENGGSSTYKQLPKCKHYFYLMVENGLHCFKLR